MQSFSTPEDFMAFINAQFGQLGDFNEQEKAKLRGQKLTQKLAGSYVKLQHHTRICGEKLFLPETRHSKVVKGSSVVRHGYFLECMETNKWLFESWTLDDGYHVLNFSVIVDDDGVQMSNGRINLFGMGMSVLDEQSYVTEQLQAQIEESLKTANYWDLKE